MFNDVKIKDVKLLIGGLIKTLRKQNKITQIELAEILDISRITVQNVEKGKNYTIDTLLKILQHFDLLFMLQEEITKFTEDNKDVKSLY